MRRSEVHLCWIFFVGSRVLLSLPYFSQWLCWTLFVSDKREQRTKQQQRKFKAKEENALQSWHHFCFPKIQGGGPTFKYRVLRFGSTILNLAKLRNLLCKFQILWCKKPQNLSFQRNTINNLSLQSDRNLVGHLFLKHLQGYFGSGKNCFLNDFFRPLWWYMWHSCEIVTYMRKKNVEKMSTVNFGSRILK